MSRLRTLSVEAKAALATGLVFLSIPLSRTLVSDSVDVNIRAKLFRLQFLLFVNVFMLTGSLFLWKRTVSKLRALRSAGPWVSRCWRALVLLFLLLAHSSFPAWFFLVAEEPCWLASLSHSCLGAYIILVFFLLLLDSARCCRRAAARAGADVLPRTGADAASPSPGSDKPTFAAVALTAALSAYGLLNASLPPEVVRVEVTLDKLPQSLNRLNVVLLSDIHLGPTVGRSRLQLIVSMVNSLDADVVAITGDLADSQVSRLLGASEPLRHMKARLGSFFVTGNHEYYTADVERWFTHLRSLNIQPLHNEHVRVSRPERTVDWICLAGVDDLEARMFGYPGHGPDLEKALAGCNTNSPIVLLAHQPRMAHRALQERPDIGLVLSGHTHAGQIFPISIVAYLVNPFFCGLYHVGESSAVYVSPGTAYYGIPMRIGSRAEITQIVLKAP
ncbi:transmembrane protein with metallophosphoesterase domain [Scleropages formosus]|uniref:transmembrane protein with metallophosphoesterase domain n=1 Tax=Scleropages formosus TaxID=113540 RepID=UPI0010FAB6F9|nr:transmembrane protein with metallophosphoesterase domain [Scleropages formosus]